MIRNQLTKSTHDDLTKLTLEELFIVAEQYGTVSIFGNNRKSPPDKYNVNISFQTIPGVRLDAKSEYNLNIFEAFHQAISKARQIVENVSEIHSHNDS